MLLLLVPRKRGEIPLVGGRQPSRLVVDIDSLGPVIVVVVVVVASCCAHPLNCRCRVVAWRCAWDAPQDSSLLG